MTVRGLPIKKDKEEKALPADKLKEEKIISAFISKGGSVSKASKKEAEEDKLKAMNVKLYQSELDKINLLRNKFPKRDRPSIHDWILLAINEKMDRDS